MSVVEKHGKLNCIKLPGVRIRGDRGCFTRPEFRSERYSYETITPTASIGIMDNTVRRKGVVWQPTRLEVLSPIEMYTVARHETTNVYSTPEALLKRGGINMDYEYTIRRTTLLHKPDYLLYFNVCHEDYDTARKMEAMVIRYLQQGRNWYSRYLGMREFMARVSLVENREDAPPPVPVTRYLGPMVHSYTWEGGRQTEVHFFNARLEEGVMNIPLEPEKGSFL